MKPACPSMALMPSSFSIAMHSSSSSIPSPCRWLFTPSQLYSRSNSISVSILDNQISRLRLKQPHVIAVADDAQIVVAELWAKIARKRRRSFELRDFDMRAEPGDGRVARPYAGDPRRDRLVEVARRRTSKQARITGITQTMSGRGIEDLGGRQNGRQRKKQRAS